ncbi:MAG TPA: GNAT family N-acetyltransferase [Ktedonobacterales bacterium]
MSSSTVSYSVRAPSRADVPAILGLIAAVDIAEGGAADPWTEADLTSEWDKTTPGEDNWLVESADGMCVGYGELAMLGNGLFLGDLYEHPTLRGRGILGDLVIRLQARARERAGEMPDGARVVVSVGTYAGETTTHDVLKAAGFSELRHHFQMRVTLTEPPHAPVWPEGIELRAFRPQDMRATFDLLDTAFQDHWGHVPDDYEMWAKRWGQEERDRSLFLLAWAGDHLAGTAMCRRRGDDLGWVGSLGVNRVWRGQGLGMALLRQALGEFWRRGIRTVGLGVDAQNLTGALRLYEKAGMSPAQHYISWEYEVRSGKDLIVRDLA